MVDTAAGVRLLGVLLVCYQSGCLLSLRAACYVREPCCCDAFMLAIVKESPRG